MHTYIHTYVHTDTYRIPLSVPPFVVDRFLTHAWFFHVCFRAIAWTLMDTNRLIYWYIIFKSFSSYFSSSIRSYISLVQLHYSLCCSYPIGHSYLYALFVTCLFICLSAYPIHQPRPKPRTECPSLPSIVHIMQGVSFYFTAFDMYHIDYNNIGSPSRSMYDNNRPLLLRGIIPLPAATAILTGRQAPKKCIPECVSTWMHEHPVCAWSCHPCLARKKRSAI